MIPLLVILAFASCGSIHECTFSNLEPEGIASISAPLEPIELLNRSPHETVLIFGTVESGDEERPISISITAPDDTIMQINATSNRDGIFHAYYPIYEIDRFDEGTYEVSGLVYTIEEEKIVPEEIGDTSFEIKITGITTGNHTIEILGDDWTAKTSCEECYSPYEIEIEYGETIEFYNSGTEAHRIHSTALLYGDDKVPKLVDESMVGMGNFFDTGLLGPDESKIIEFEESGAILYGCLLHPWMEGTIEIGDVETEAESIVDIKEEEQVKRAQTQIITDKDEIQLHNAADKLSLKYSFSDGKNWYATVRIYDPEGNRMDSERLKSEDGTAVFETITQPTWTPGTYDIVIIPSNKKIAPLNVTAVISEHETVGCPMTSIKAEHGYKSGCFAEKVKKIDGDTIRVGNQKVRLTLSDPINATAKIQEACPIGSIAIVDRDTTLLLDTRVVREAGIRQGYFAAVYCEHTFPSSLNEQLIIAGLAEADSIGCLTTEFEWGRCLPPPPEFIVEEEEVTAEENCAIAFAIHGTKLAMPAQVLREYRDDSNLYWAIEPIHAAYYAVSPYIVDMERNNPHVKAAVYGLLYAPLTISASILGG